MAINKSRTSPLMKTLILMLAGTFVLSIGFAGLSTIPSCSSGHLFPVVETGSTTQPASTETTGQINARYDAKTKALEASITVDPKNYELLVTEADAYLNWALDFANAVQQWPDPTSPVWASAISYYERALTVKATEGPVFGDYALALFRSGDTTSAIVASEQSRKLDPKGAMNLYYLGGYYEAAGNEAKALEAYQACLAAGPPADLTASVQERITALSAQ
jgi:tetratricopeptide (TPR) repeat protein